MLPKPSRNVVMKGEVHHRERNIIAARGLVGSQWGRNTRLSLLLPFRLRLLPLVAEPSDSREDTGALVLSSHPPRTSCLQSQAEWVQSGSQEAVGNQPAQSICFFLSFA